MKQRGRDKTVEHPDSSLSMFISNKAPLNHKNKRKDERLGISKFDNIQLTVNC